MFEEKDYELWCGDCLELMNNIPDKFVDMIITDLPYGQTARNKWDIVIPFESLWKQYNRIIKDNGAIILFANGMFTAELMMSNKKMWRYNLIWEKTQPTGFLNAKKMPLRNHEDICVFYKKPPTYNPQKTSGHKRKISKAEHKIGCKETLDYGQYKLSTYDSTERYPKSVWKFAKDVQKSALHPTQKPVALVKEFIVTYTNPGEVVLDSCSGSDTTAIAALDTGRKVICIENDEEIFRVGRDRVMNHIAEIKQNEVQNASTDQLSPEYYNRIDDGNDIVFVPYRCEDCIYGEYSLEDDNYYCSIGASNFKECEQNYTDDDRT